MAYDGWPSSNEERLRRACEALMLRDRLKALTCRGENSVDSLKMTDSREAFLDRISARISSQDDLFAEQFFGLKSALFQFVAREREVPEFFQKQAVLHITALIA